MAKWYCPDCGKVFPEPTRRWLYDDGATATPEDLCPKCGSSRVEEMERCRACGYGWKLKKDHVCEKCHIRNVSDVKMFARRYCPEALADLNDILDGNGLEMFL